MIFFKKEIHVIIKKQECLYTRKYAAYTRAIF